MINSDDFINEFSGAAYLDAKYAPWVKSRTPGLIIARILIVSEGDSSLNFWWAPFVGIETIAVLKFKTNPFTNIEYLEDVCPVRLMNTKIIEGRSISVSSISIL